MTNQTKVRAIGLNGELTSHPGWFFRPNDTSRLVELSEQERLGIWTQMFPLSVRSEKMDMDLEFIPTHRNDDVDYFEIRQTLTVCSSFRVPSQPELYTTHSWLGENNELLCLPGFYCCPKDTTGLQELTSVERREIVVNQGNFAVAFIDPDSIHLSAAMNNRGIPTHRKIGEPIPPIGFIPADLKTSSMQSRHPSQRTQTDSRDWENVDPEEIKHLRALEGVGYDRADALGRPLIIDGSIRFEKGALLNAQQYAALQYYFLKDISAKEQN